MHVMNQRLARERTVAIDAVRRASAACRRIAGQLVSADVLAKSDSSPVTVADFASQAVVCRVLAEHFPADGVIGEEGADDLRGDARASLRAAVTQAVGAAFEEAVTEAQVLAWIDRGAAGPTGGAPRRWWTLDPIDGTKGFLRGEQYAVALALLDAGQTVLGVLGCPNLPQLGGSVGSLFVAVRGGGSEQLPLSADESEDVGGRIAVADPTSPADIRFCESVESGHSDQGASARIAAALGITAAPYRIDSQCKYAAIARGDAAIYLRLPTKADYREKIWDHAAGAILVTEAGGVVTDVWGRPLDFSLGRELVANQGVIATCGRGPGLSHDQVVAAVQEVLSSSARERPA